MKMAKKFFCFMMSVLLLVCTFTGCKKGSVSSIIKDDDDVVSVAEASDLVIPYSREDGVNPYTASSLMNLCIVPLMYGSLYTINEHYEPQAQLATSAGISGANLIVELNTDALFSDGTNVSVGDVVYSFDKAKKSDFYGSGLSTILSAKALGESTVTFELRTRNRYAAALLTFPIVKTGTATDTDSVPIGTGPYKYKATEDGGILKLRKGFDGKAKQLYLTNITDTDSLLSSLAIGNMDLAFDDMADGKLERVSNVKEAQVDMNQILIIGINGKTGNFNHAKLRQYLSAALDRKALISAGVDGYGTATNMPFNPNWYYLAEAKTPSVNAKEAKAALAKAFQKKTITILTDKSNTYKIKMANAVAQQLANMGVNTKVKAVKYKEYAAAVVHGNYDLYIGEFKLTNDMDLSCLVGGSLQDALDKTLAGNMEVADFVAKFYEVMPFVTVGFRNGVICYTPNMTTDITSLPNAPFANVADFAKKVS